MIIDGKFEEITVTEEELDLTADESLPWLEAEDDDGTGGGIDGIQVMTFLAGLLLIAAVIVGLVWYFTGPPGSSEPVADGSTIEAPEGPIKERPEDPGGKEFAGTGNVAPGVGEGQTTDAQIGGGEEAGEASGETPRPSIDRQTTETASSGEGTAAATAGGVAVQLAAYGNRARAERGWSQLSRSTSALDGVRYRIVQGTVDIGTVYRLQAMAPNRAEADKLCAALKADGLECAVKP